MSYLSASAFVVREDCILLVRHKYGVVKNQLLIPGGRTDDLELPPACAVRETFEETQIRCSVDRLLAVRFTSDNSWFIFLCNYETGEPIPDGHEVDFAGFVSISNMIEREDVTSTSKRLLNAYLENPDKGLRKSDYKSANLSDNEYLLYV